MTNGQQRPTNPNRFALFRSQPFDDGRQPNGDYSISLTLSIDMLLEIMDALQNGVIQPEPDYKGVPTIQLWGTGYRGTMAPGKSGKPGPAATGTINTPKAIWQAKQRQQQADPIYPGQPVQTPQQQQVAPAYAAAFPPQQAAAAPVAPPPANPAPTPTPRPHPLPGGQWSTAPAPAASGWRSATGTMDGQKASAPADEAGLPY